MIKTDADASASYVLVIACLMMLSSLALQAATGSLPPTGVLPTGSVPVVRAVDVVFPSTARAPAVATETYFYYIHTKPSRPTEGDWVLFDAHAIADDVRRLWATGFLENISVDVMDEPYDNGVVGKHVVFKLEERVRIANVEFSGSTALDAAEIDRKLVESNARIPLDSMLDEAKIKRVEDLLRDMLRDHGYPSASVTHRVADFPATGRARLTFVLVDGRREKVGRIVLSGVSSSNEKAVRKRLKSTKRNASFDPSKFDADAQRILDYYRNNGYAFATVGSPIVTPVRLASSNEWVDVEIPVTEGKRYRVGTIGFDGNHLAKDNELLHDFAIAPGGYYDASTVRRGLEIAREWYGAHGYYEFTGYPDIQPRGDGSALVDVTIRLAEGDQYFIHQIAVNGNTSTRDDVIRRELPITEGQVLNTEALKLTVRRLNQLTYFQSIGERDVKVERTPGLANYVDVTFDVKERRRDNVNFGGGASQAEGVFGNISYKTPNLFGRGQTLTLVAQQGIRGNLYEAKFAEPHLFGGAFSSSLSVFGSETAYETTTTADAYSEGRKGVTLTFGRAVTPLTRLQFAYTYEIDSLGIDQALLASGLGGAGSPALTSSDLGSHTDSRLMIGVVRNTIDHPFMPHRGTRLSADVQLASNALGGDYNYVKPEAEAVWYQPTSSRTGIGLRAQAGVLKMYDTTNDVPYFLR